MVGYKTGYCWFILTFILYGGNKYGNSGHSGHLYVVTAFDVLFFMHAYFFIIPYLLIARRTMQLRVLKSKFSF